MTPIPNFPPRITIAGERGSFWPVSHESERRNIALHWFAQSPDVRINRRAGLSWPFKPFQAAWVRSGIRKHKRRLVIGGQREMVRFFYP